MAAIIQMKGLSKRYGTLDALADLHLEIEEGSVFGFIGPNGAGKTTTMRILTTLLKPTAGEASIGGFSVTRQPEQVRRIIGYMPDFFGVYDDMKVIEYLEFFAAAYRIKGAERRRVCDEKLEVVDLDFKRDAMANTLSRGQTQRLGLARVLLHDPQVLLLDEPLSGLDPRARIEMRELLRELQNMGKTIFFSSHILSEVADICTSIGIMEAGQLVTHGRLEDMRRQFQMHRLIRARVLDDPAGLRNFLQERPEITLMADGQSQERAFDVVEFDFTGDDDGLSRLLQELVAAGYRLVSFNEEPGDLEDVFMRVTKGLVN